LELAAEAADRHETTAAAGDASPATDHGDHAAHGTDAVPPPPMPLEWLPAPAGEMRPMPAHGPATDPAPDAGDSGAHQTLAEAFGKLPWTDPVVVVGMVGVLSLLIAAMLALKSRA
jgi:hypothetical protein